MKKKALSFFPHSQKYIVLSKASLVCSQLGKLRCFLSNKTWFLFFLKKYKDKKKKMEWLIILQQETMDEGMF